MKHSILSILLLAACSATMPLNAQNTGEQKLSQMILAAEQGDAAAQYYMGNCYAKGQGVTQNSEEAVKWYRLSAEQEYGEAQNKLGEYYAKGGAGLQRDMSEAVKWYRKAAENGNAKALFNLGVCYDNGDGVRKDSAEAVQYYRLAAEKGNAEAQCNLGSCYYLGSGIGMDFTEAAKWFRKAADQGNAAAQVKFGTCLAGGDGVGKDFEEAVKWFRKAADQGNAEAMIKLGDCHANGTGVDKDLKEAAVWYTKAADLDSFDAAYKLGECYEYGTGVEKDFQMAKEYYLLATHILRHTKETETTKLLREKMYQLGNQYAKGHDNDKELREALTFYWAAAILGKAEALTLLQQYANQGNANAQYFMGATYLNGGVGIRRNLSKAEQWYRKAERQGHLGAIEELGNLRSDLRQYYGINPIYRTDRNKTGTVSVSFTAPPILGRAAAMVCPFLFLCRPVFR